MLSPRKNELWNLIILDNVLSTTKFRRSRITLTERGRWKVGVGSGEWAVAVGGESRVLYVRLSGSGRVGTVYTVHSAPYRIQNYKL